MKPSVGGEADQATSNFLHAIDFFLARATPTLRALLAGVLAFRRVALAEHQVEIWFSKIQLAWMKECYLSAAIRRGAKVLNR